MLGAMLIDHLRLFIVGTDTGVGKTHVCAGLLRALRARGRSSVAMKPICSGCEVREDGLINDDIETLRLAGDPNLRAQDLGYYRFAPAIAPHRAAELAGVDIEIAPIVGRYQELSRRYQDVLVEGVGGFAVPLSARAMLADLIAALNLPVVLVVGLRLGCINHALISAQAIRAAGLPLAGWIANRVDPAMAEVDASVTAITARIETPLLGRVGHGASSVAFDALATALLTQCGTSGTAAGRTHTPS